MYIRPAQPADHGAILALNTESQWAMTPLDAPALDALIAMAERVLVAEAAGEIAAFALALAPGAPYDSANFRWFCERYASFLYLDRIAVGGEYRRRGVGGAIYEAMEAHACAAGRMLCEVNLVPPNQGSLDFHAARAFVRVGTLEHPGGKVVAMFAKELVAP